MNSKAGKEIKAYGGVSPNILGHSFASGISTRSKAKQYQLDVSQPCGLSKRERALQFHSVSVLADGALCIGSLMSLDLGVILDAEPKEDRMQKAWDLLAPKKDGTAALVIFSDEQKIDAPGWRCAPKSPLSV